MSLDLSKRCFRKRARGSGLMYCSRQARSMNLIHVRKKLGESGWYRKLTGWQKLKVLAKTATIAAPVFPKEKVSKRRFFLTAHAPDAR